MVPRTEAATPAFPIVLPDLESLPHPAILFDSAGCAVATNMAFTEMTGREAGHMRGRTIDALFSPDTNATAAAEVRAAIDEGRVYTGELLTISALHEAFWTELIVWPQRDGTGALLHVTVMLRDMTARRDAETALLLQGGQRSFVLDRIQAGIVVHKATTEILYANARATELLGVSHDRILGAVNTDPRWRFIDESGAPVPISDYPVNRAVATRAVVKDLCFGVRQSEDARTVWLMCNAYPVMNDDGEPSEVVTSFTDVTEIKEAQQALQRTDERLTLILEGSRDAPWDWVVPTNEVYYSPRWYEMLGYAPGELEEDTELWHRLQHPDDRPRIASLFERYLLSDITSYELEFRLRHKGGHWVTVLARGLISRDAAGQPIRVSGTNTDITEKRAMEVRLRQTQKLEAIGQLAGGVAHDFNNLLAVITGNLELLRSELAVPAETMELLDEAVSAARKGADLTRRLLASTRQQTLQPTVADVGHTINHLVPVLQRLIGETIHVEAELPRDLSHVLIDVGQLENALINLAINARDAMPKGGALTISAMNLAIDAGAMPDDLRLSPGTYVRLAITDTGVGMPKAVLQRSLEPFFTTKPVGQGTGLGLSMVYGFLRQSGGGVKIFSEVGCGTAVHLYVPATSAASATESVLPDLLPLASRSRPEVILVTEDDAGVRHFCLKALTSLGYQTIEAADGAAALAALATAERVDLLLTDVIMPNGMNGPELVAQLRQHAADIPVIYMSGYPANMLDSEDALADAELLSKPFTKSALARTIRHRLDAMGVGDSLAH